MVPDYSGILGPAGVRANLYNIGRLTCITDLIPHASSSAYALDVGCGTGEWNAKMAEILKRRGYTYIGLDISKNLLLTTVNSKRSYTYEHNGEAYVLSNACSLPFRRCFKLILALEIIEHLDNPDEFLVEIKNLLLKDRYLIISTPNKFSLDCICGKIREFFGGKKWTAWDEEHKHIFSFNEFLSIARKHFSIVKVLGYHFLPRIQFTGKLNSILKTSSKPLNKLGFQTIALLKKAD